MRERQMTDALESLACDTGALGLSAGVRHFGGDPVFAAWGLDGRNPDSPMPASGKFRIGSVTKTFTSSLVLDLIDRGDLSFDATVDQWFPTYPHAELISVRSLLTHRAGTADMIFDGFSDYVEMLLSDLSRRFTPDDVIGLMGALPPFAVPDQSYRYSNTDYLLLGAIAERVSGHAFGALLAQRLTTPLGLGATSYDSSVADDLLHGWFALDSDGTPDPSRPHDVDVREFPNEALITSAFAGGGMTSTLSDLLAWGEALYLGQLLSPSMRECLLASPSFEDPASGGSHGLGVFGFGAKTPDGAWTGYGHAGNIVGSSAVLASFPSSQVTVAVHANVLEVPAPRFVELALELSEIGTSDE